MNLHILTQPHFPQSPWHIYPRKLATFTTNSLNLQEY